MDSTENHETPADTLEKPNLPDPFLILQERELRQKEEKEREVAEKAAAEAARAEQAKLDLNKVPDVVNQILEELPKLYDDLRNSEYINAKEGEQLKSANLVDVLIEKQPVEPAKHWSDRFVFWSKKVATKQYEIKQAVCWRVGFMTLDEMYSFIELYLDVETGEVYVYSRGPRSRYVIRPLSTVVLLSLSYEKATKLLEEIRDRRKHIAWMANHEA